MTAPTPLELLAERGGAQYDREPISQLDHALQSAQLALDAGVPETLQLAALFHDVGHLLPPDAHGASMRGEDPGHERIGAKYLARWFGDAICRPVALHVDAKRMLCRDSAYRANLSPESERSLVLQGGPMTDEDAMAFRALPWAEAAIALRRFDDLAKDPSARPLPLSAWRPLTVQHVAALRNR